MALPIFQRTVVDNSGNIQPNAQISVFSEATGLPVEVFADRNGSDSLGSVFFVGSSALVRFYAPPGEYRIQADGQSGQINWRFVQLIDTQDITTIASNFAAVEAVNDNLAAVQAAPQAALDAAEARDEAEAARDAAEGFKDDAEAAAAQLDPAILPWLAVPLGYTTQPLTIDDPDLYPPTDNPLFRYVLLSAGENGVGGYNEGLLINEVVDADYEDSRGHKVLRATAEIAVGPLQGTVIDLVNTEGAALTAGVSGIGSLFADQGQRITGLWNEASLRNVNAALNGEGAISAVDSANQTNHSGDTTRRVSMLAFNSANSPDYRASATTAGRTEVIHVNGLSFMRIM